MCEKQYRISDSELLYLIAQGNLDAKRMLDRRYERYCKGLTKEYLESHNDYGFSYEDYYDASILGYCKARNRFNFEESTAFYPYFKKYAESEMKALSKEGNKFYLNEAPKRFISFDITYKCDDDSITLAERCGESDNEIKASITKKEVLDLLAQNTYKMTNTELEICINLALNHSSKEIRKSLNLTSTAFAKNLKSIKRKIGRDLSSIVK